MDVKERIMQKIKENGEVRSSEIVEETGFSRTHVNSFFRELREEGKIVLIGKANKARYIPASKQAMEQKKKEIKKFHRIYTNKGLAEDVVLSEIKKESGIFLDIPENVERILNYSFTEMLNNAIEHSQSDTIEVIIKRDSTGILFEVNDSGIGIFNSIIEKKNLSSEIEAIQDLHKGKETTAPEAHTGEGIFFTSKVADILIFKSGTKKLIFNNVINDVFVKDIKKIKGTKVTFTIGLDSQTELTSIFSEYTDRETYEFSKTKVVVKLYSLGTEYVSRSQARRVTAGLDKFKTVVLDFKSVETVGQAFADEVFRVWQAHHPEVSIIYRNANENIEFMIKRAQK